MKMTLHVKKGVGSIDHERHLTLDGRTVDIVDILDVMGLSKELTSEDSERLVNSDVLRSLNWKIVGSDNLARETVNDVVYADELPCRETAEKICDVLNKRLTDDSDGRYYQVREQNYKIHEYQF